VSNIDERLIEKLDKACELARLHSARYREVSSSAGVTIGAKGDEVLIELHGDAQGLTGAWIDACRSRSNGLPGNVDPSAPNCVKITFIPKPASV
jgi:hypothetical protein